MALEKCALNLNRACKELRPHGTLEFPCAAFASWYAKNPEKVIPWHWHEEIEVLYLESGTMRVEIPGKVIHLKEGEGFFINSNILHFGIGEPYCELHSLVFHPSLVMGSENSIFAVKYLNPLINCSALDGCMLEVTEDFKKAFEAMRFDDTGYEFTVRAHLSQMCFSLYQRYEEEIETGYSELDQDSIRMRIMLDYIHKHFSENLELAQIAKTADVGERECLRCFQRVIHISPMQYLLKYRVTQGASQLLRYKDRSIAEIATQCGFDSPSNFSQMFKRFFKCTPREYRKGEEKHSETDDYQS